MKELMVILLLVTWTGMVVAQQNNDNGFRPPGGTSGESSFGSKNGRTPLVPIVSGDDSTRGGGEPTAAMQRAQSAFSTGDRSSDYPGTSSMLDSRTTVRDSFPPRTPVSTNPYASSGSTSGGGTNGSSTRQPIYLGLPTDAQNALREYGSVKAPIPDSFVDRITISDKNEPKQGLRQSVNAVLRGDTLVFEMTPTQLANIDEYSFDFEVPASYKGQYRSATIEYPPTLQRLATQTPRSTTGDNTLLESEDPRWRLAASDQDPQPRAPVDRTRPWDDNRVTDVDSQYQRELRRRQLAQDDKWLREKEAIEKQELAKKALWLEEELARMRAQPRNVPPAQQNLYPPGRFADNSFLTGQTITPIVPPANYPAYGNGMTPAADANTLAVMQMQSQMKQMVNRVAQLDNENQFLKNEIRSTTTENNRRDLFDIGRDGYRSGLASNASMPGDRRTEADPPNINRPVMSVGGNRGLTNNTDSKSTILAKDDLSRREGARSNETLLMLLMLLCSVGLNLYLWFLSRTFYSRYQELADELRETFTATV